MAHTVSTFFATELRADAEIGCATAPGTVAWHTRSGAPLSTYLTHAKSGSNVGTESSSVILGPAHRVGHLPAGLDGFTLI